MAKVKKKTTAKKTRISTKKSTAGRKKKTTKKTVSRPAKKKATRKATKKKTTSRQRETDRATLYAKAVMRRSIKAGPHVRNACKRHIADLKRKDVFYDRPAAALAIDYFETVLRLAGGEYEGKPFILEPWQAFVIGSVFGWKRGDDHSLRRFGVVYVETGKGSGKTPLAAGVGLRMMTSDTPREPRAEIYAVASQQDQAMVLFRDAITMYKQSPDLSDRLKSSGAAGREWNLYYSDRGSFFRPISSERTGRGKSGPRPHCNLFDEIHELPTRAMIDFMSSGKKWRKQALDFMITNSGYDRTSVCYEYHKYGIDVCDGTLDDDNYFAYICALDDGDDPFKDEKCWIKANPSLPKIPGLDYLRNQVTEARGMPSKESLVRRLNFCEWVGAENPWISREAWFEVLDDKVVLSDYHDVPCAGAIDLSGRADLTAMSLVFNGEERAAFSWFWTPEDTLMERGARDRVPYETWVRQGQLIAVPGKSIDYSYIAHHIRDIMDEYNLKILGFDRYRIHDLIRELNNIGVDTCIIKIVVEDDEVSIVTEDGEPIYGLCMLPHGQGYRDMAPAVDELEEDVLNGTIIVDNNPVMTMCSANAVLTSDPADNRKFAKNKSTGRIDGIVSLAMANRVAGYLDDLADGSVYDTEDLMLV